MAAKILTTQAGNWSIDEAGFVTVEVFDRNRKSEVVSLLTNLFGVPPEAVPGPATVTSTAKPVTTIDVTKWNLDNQIVGRVFSDSAKTFQVEMGPLLNTYLTVRVLLIDNPTVPFLLLFILVDLHPEKIDRSSMQFSIRDQLHRLSLPFRLFLEKTGGLSSQGASWSPRIASVTWVGFTVDEERLARLRTNLARLQQLRASGAGTIEEQDKIEGEIINDEPIDLADPAVKITSHIPAYKNLHMVLSQMQQPGLSKRSLSILYLTTDRQLLHSFPDMRNVFLTQFPSRVDWAPVFGDSLLPWLLALNIWTTHRQHLLAANLDQRALMLRESPTVKSTEDKIRATLSDVSLLGTDTAVASGEVNLVRRRSDSLLNELIKGGPLSVEIPLRIRDPFLLQFVTEPGTGVAAGIASMTKESLEAAAEHLRQVETEVANFQRHISDIASLQAREASSKLEKTIARLTIFLVALTAVLVATSFSDKLPSSLELLPWELLGLAAQLFGLLYGVRWIRRRRKASSSLFGPLPKNA